MIDTGKPIAAARQAGGQLLVFPDLSLSGYELPLLRACSLTANDAVRANTV